MPNVLIIRAKMATSKKLKSFSLKSLGKTDSDYSGNNTVTMYEALHGKTREKIVLQRLMVIARLPGRLADRTELEAHYEKLRFQLSKQYLWDHLTGLLMVYPSCLLHVVESSREVLLSVLKDLTEVEEQPDCALLEAPKVVFLAHNPESRLFQQWSYKVVGADQGPGDPQATGFEEAEENTETLVCRLLSELQKLSEHIETQKAVPGPVLEETLEMIVPEGLLLNLLASDDLLTPQQHLQMYNSPLNISMDCGQAVRSSCLTTV